MINPRFAQVRIPESIRTNGPRNLLISETGGAIF